MNRAIKIGLTLFIIGGILYIIGLILSVDPVSTESIYILFEALSIPFLLGGPAKIISGLSPRNRGIVFIGIGIIFCLFTTFFVFRIIIPWFNITQEVSIILYLFNLLFWFLIFIVPGIMLIIYEKMIKTYFILDLLIITTLMWKAIYIIILSSFSELTFGEFFLQNFWQALGIGFILGLITTGIAYLFGHF